MKELKVSAIRNGTVIDHIPAKLTMKLVELLDLHDELITIGINLHSEQSGVKGIIKIADKVLSQTELNKIAVLAPSVTINIIENYNVIRKSGVKIPSKIEKVLQCTNPHCITRSEGSTKFHILSKDPVKIKCHYCETIIDHNDIIIS